MSILLDSLRKSEARHKSRAAPTIHSADAYGGGSRQPARWPAVTMIVLAAAAIGWFGWRQYAEPPAMAEAASETDGAVREIPVSEEVRAAEGDVDDRPQAEPLAPGEPRTPVERLAQSRDGGDGVESSAGAGEAAPEDSTPVERIAAFSGESESSPAETQSAGPGGPVPERAPAERDAVDPSAMEELASVQPARPERQPSARERAEPGEPEPMSYWQLPQQWRSEMPEMRITVLVYAQAPEDRFVLMNGERLKEGDELDGGVVLEEIRREGAVFSYRSRQFMVKS